MIKSCEVDRYTNVSYPCLMSSSDGEVVLFTDINKGTVVKDATICNPKDSRIGYVGRSFCMSAFKPYVGQILLENCYD